MYTYTVSHPEVTAILAVNWEQGGLFLIPGHIVSADGAELPGWRLSHSLRLSSGIQPTARFNSP